MLALAAAAAFQASTAFTGIPATQIQSSDLMRYGLFALNIVLTLLSASVLIGLFFFYPMIRAHTREKGQFEQMTESLTRKSATFQQAALTDPLTGLNNRRYFDDALKEYMQEFSKIGLPIGIMVLDIDHFKAVNDTHGHDVGDDVIRGLADCLRDYTRHHDISARMGGEEFAVVAPNLDAAGLDRLANRLRVAVSNLDFAVGNVHLRVTISIGIAVWDGKESGTSFYKRADANLYAAKRAGRNRVCA